MSVRLLSRRGAIGTSWHAIALRETLEKHLGPARSRAGRRLAREDRVQWLDIAPGRARAGVLGDDGQIAQASLEVTAPRSDDRPALLRILRSHPELPARLAGGVYPEAIEHELVASEMALLPDLAAGDLTHSCTCLDWPGPCVHVAALAFVLVEAVDAQPIHLLTLRDLTLAEAAQPLRSEPGEPAATVDPPSKEETAAVPADPSASDASDAEKTEDHSERPDFDPVIADPTLLQEVLGDEAADAIASFYRAAGSGAPGAGRETGAGADLSAR